MACHYGNKLAFEFMGIEWYGGGTMRGVSLGTDIDIYVDVGSRLTAPITYTGFSVNVPANVKRIVIDWPDMSTPALYRPDWKNIIHAVYSEPNVRKVLIACIGGHGRTGTALACIGGLLGAKGYVKDPVAAVRAAVCSDCIETAGQISYISLITGIDVHHHKGTKTFLPKDKDTKKSFWDDDKPTAKVQYDKSKGPKHQTTETCNEWLKRNSNRYFSGYNDGSNGEDQDNG